MTSVSDFFLLGDIVRRDRGSIRTGPFGTTLKASEYAAVGVPVVSVGEVGYGSFRVHKETRRVGPEVLKRLPVYRLNVDDIVFARKGAVDRSAVVRDGQDGWFLGSDGIRVRLGRGSRQVNPIYLGYALGGADVRRWLLRNATGTTMATLNQGLLERVPVWLPERREQDRIASALDDASDLVDALERLIAKKRDVKQGVMRELLTGRTRLPGYSAGWELSAFDEIMEVVNTRGSQVDANKYCEVGTFPVVDQGKEFIAGYVGSEHSPISPGVDGVFVFGDHTTISKYVDFDFVVGADGTKVLRSRSSSNYLSRYICYCLELYPVESTGYNRHFGKLRERQFLLPRGEEQRAIVKTLQDADAELAALEQRLESARAVKVGMMQELLTGRTRLPVKEEA